ncbi:ABC transporter ATP-binding protein [Salinicoccus sp. ID82-1]|uniref:ABC transporter ATP-binding protein n=1 Tax=Salinicoccus cyprini TaxID=2493691 RepID=A0A558ARN6_9STAP|nr:MULTISPECIES: ABC transporter ATP-binding protein [Salinicoccus]MCG1009488.1 ABC transporter ATP-binding protein [Salinicoccus sp. ID82-1]TVT26925.1 ABC transporter ATP-binding protein [Salinicoccus cyprini]
MKSVISVEGLKKQFDNEEALKDISFEVGKGEIFGLLGPSGSGKTTTIKILTGELEPSGGLVEVLGYQHGAFKKSEYVRSLGILSDNSSLYERLTVKDNLALFRKLYNTEQSKVDQVLKDVGLEKHINKRVKDLSKGMKQRILLCKAVLHEPAVLFLDEPTSALDPVTTDSIHDMLLKIKARGTTIMLTTHNMDEATVLCDTVAFLNEGIIIDNGSPDALRQSYKTNDMHITYDDGRTKQISLSPENKVQLEAALFDTNVVNMKSDYPTLGEVFKKVTGKELV